MGIIESITGQQKEVSTLSEIQAKRLVEGTTNKMDRTIFVLVLNSGIALQEMLSVRVSDIDWKEGTITVYQKSVRSIRLPSNAVQELREYVGSNFEDRLLFSIKMDALLNRIRAYQGICPFDWRVLRKTYAALALKKKNDPEIVANNLGMTVSYLYETFKGVNSPSERPQPVI